MFGNMVFGGIVSLKRMFQHPGSNVISDEFARAIAPYVKSGELRIANTGPRLLCIPNSIDAPTIREEYVMNYGKPYPEKPPSVAIDIGQQPAVLSRIQRWFGCGW